MKANANVDVVCVACSVAGVSGCVDPSARVAVAASGDEGVVSLQRVLDGHGGFAAVIGPVEQDGMSAAHGFTSPPLPPTTIRARIDLPAAAPPAPIARLTAGEDTAVR